MDNDFKLFAFAMLSLIGVGYVLLPKSKNKEFLGNKEFLENKEREPKKEEIFYEDNKKVEEPKAPEEKKEN